MAKFKTKVRAFASIHPATGINPYWVRSRAKEIRGEPGSNAHMWWQRCVKRGWRIVPVIITVEGKKRSASRHERGDAK